MLGPIGPHHEIMMILAHVNIFADIMCGICYEIMHEVDMVCNEGCLRFFRDTCRQNEIELL